MAISLTLSFEMLASQVKTGKDPLNLAGCIAMVADTCLLYTSPSPRDQRGSRMPSSA